MSNYTGHPGSCGMALLLRVSADAAAGLKIQPKCSICVLKTAHLMLFKTVFLLNNMHIGLINKKKILCVLKHESMWHISRSLKIPVTGTR